MADKDWRYLAGVFEQEIRDRERLLGWDCRDWLEENVRPRFLIVWEIRWRRAYLPVMPTLGFKPPKPIESHRRKAFERDLRP
ncbi:MAG: hypothetical protein M3R31_06645 [Pseudomonadota bacterium]|nr:hypothetical protein [Pseudomonadota bacterium]